jgi:hypothetical protein
VDDEEELNAEEEEEEIGLIGGWTNDKSQL